MSYILNSLKRVTWGNVVGVLKEDARRFHFSSYRVGTSIGSW